jgi:hypothetical protein
VAPGVGEIRREALREAGADDVVVRALYSGISRGTEALVFSGRVPPTEYHRMRAPFQAGELPGPVKYGYASVGTVEQGPGEMIGRGIFALFPHQTRYVVPAAAVHLLPAVGLDQSPLNTPAYPMAVRRLDGLAARLPTDPLSAPDIILLADRSKQLTYLNKQDGRVLEKLDVATHRHFHSDHGHLNASDSLVPMMFVRGGQEGRDTLASICEASLVDITPTILDILGLLPSFNAALQDRPDQVKGHSLKPAMDRILTKAPPLVSENVCAAPTTVRLPRKSD